MDEYVLVVLWISFLLLKGIRGHPRRLRGSMSVLTTVASYDTQAEFQTAVSRSSLNTRWLCNELSHIVLFSAKV